MKTILASELHVAPGISLLHAGPALDHGPLPSIFYFALSSHDSLTQDPFNQLVQFLSDRWIRFFSLTLPAHEAGLSPHDALGVWAEDIAKGQDPLGTFFDHAHQAIAFAIHQQLVNPEKLAIAGLSRGGFIALHLAAQEKKFQHILLFAPLIRLEKAKEFRDMATHPTIRALDLMHQTEALADRHIRSYIGNKDTRVDTRSAFEFSLHLAENSKLRSPKIELIMSPSVGQMGHGTPPEIFCAGGEWLAECLGAKSV